MIMYEVRRDEVRSTHPSDRLIQMKTPIVTFIPKIPKEMTMNMERGRKVYKYLFSSATS